MDGNIKLKNAFMVVSLFTGVFFVALGFNTIDQMIIRYKYYDGWRTTESWEMCHFWTPNWWEMYIASVLMLIVGGVLLGMDTAFLLREAVKT